MLNFFKRKPVEAAKTPANAQLRSRQSTPPSAGPLVPEPAPLPEVSEGNLDSDWAMWEDSVAFQDSQMPSSFGELDSVKDRTREEKEDAPDPYARVRRRE